MVSGCCRYRKCSQDRHGKTSEDELESREGLAPSLDVCSDVLVYALECGAGTVVAEVWCGGEVEVMCVAGEPGTQAERKL